MQSLMNGVWLYLLLKLVVQLFFLQCQIYRPWRQDISLAFLLSRFFQLHFLHLPRLIGSPVHLSLLWYEEFDRSDTAFVFLLFLGKISAWRYTCNRYLQLQKDGDLAPRKQLLYTAPSCWYRTNVAVFGKDSQLLECSQCKSAQFRIYVKIKRCSTCLFHKILKVFYSTLVLKLSCLLTYISLRAYRHARLYRTPGSWR